MAEQVLHHPDIYRIDVPLTGNPLKNLNSYVIKDQGESMVIDTGFRNEECLKVLYEADHRNPARIFMPNQEFFVTEITDGARIRIGNVEVTALEMPGHTPGLMCCYLEKEKVMFTTAHVLFDITPNITNWLGMEDPLGCYLKNLDRSNRI